MKFMKLGSKPDSFQSNQDSIRFVATELATDVVINVGDIKFYLHKFPLLSKSARLQKLIAVSSSSSSADDDEIRLPDIPGGSSAFEICAKFCYGMTVTLNAYNVVSARCAAEYLEMYESVEAGNLVYKIEVFLNSSVFKSWKDSIIVLQTTEMFHPWSEDAKLEARCLESIATKAGMDRERVDWSFTYNRRNLLPLMPPNVKIPKDWWIEDLAELSIELYEKAISCITRNHREVSPQVIGEALELYAAKRLENNEYGEEEDRVLIETLVSLLPKEKSSVSIRFLIDLLKSSVCGEEEKRELTRRIGEKLEEANASDLLIRASSSSSQEETVYDVDIVESLIDEFVKQTEMKKKKKNLDDDDDDDDDEFVVVSESSKAIVAKLIDGYLAEIARIDLGLSSLKFVEIAEKVSDFPRVTHDGVYRAIDMFLKQHPEITKTEKKSICRLMDPRKLSPEACAHAVQNERLPLRVVVQILFFEQLRATCPPPPPPPTTTTTNTITTLTIHKPSLPPSGSHGSSSRTTTEEEEEEEFDPITAMKTATTTVTTRRKKTTTMKKAKEVVMSKIFSKLWTGKDSVGGGGDFISSTDTSASPGSVTTVDDKSTPSTRRRRS